LYTLRRVCKRTDTGRGRETGDHKNNNKHCIYLNTLCDLIIIVWAITVTLYLGKHSKDKVVPVLI